MGYPPATACALLSMGRANAHLVARTGDALPAHVAPRVVPWGMVGASDFNLTLVNRMEPDDAVRRGDDYRCMTGRVSVGWHRDSGLEDFSSIAVYQRIIPSGGTGWGATTAETIANDDPSSSLWGLALRAMDGGAGGPLLTIPPLLVPLPSGSVYYMLDDFNHNHEHAVISPSTKRRGCTTSTTRYSSTHRVARGGAGHVAVHMR